MSKPMVSKPFGPSKLGKSFGPNWNNLNKGVYGPVICEVCGTEHERTEDETYTISLFLGRELVEECCGSLIDQVYVESGSNFITAFLGEFVDNPMGFKFFSLIDDIKNTLEEVAKKLAVAKDKTEKVLEQIKEVKKQR